MCLLIENKIKTTAPMYAFVLKAVSGTQQNKAVYSLMEEQLLQKSRQNPDYYEDPLWSLEFRPGHTAGKGMFHCIARMDDAMDALRYDDWQLNFKSAEYRLALYLVEIPPSDVIYEGVHFRCSTNLNYKRGWGVKSYKLLMELSPHSMFRTSLGTPVYKVNADALILQTTDIKIVPASFKEISSILGSLEAAEVIALTCDSSFFYKEQFDFIFNKEN